MDFVEMMRQAHAAKPSDPLAAIALGDAAEEAGDHWLARSARYMAQSGHVPRQNEHGEWSWQSLHDEGYYANPPSATPHRLTQEHWWHVASIRHPLYGQPRLDNVEPMYGGTPEQDKAIPREILENSSRIANFPDARSAHDAYHQGFLRWQSEQDNITATGQWKPWYELKSMRCDAPDDSERYSESYSDFRKIK